MYKRQYELENTGVVVEFDPQGVQQSPIIEAPVAAASQGPNDGALAVFQPNGEFVVATRVVMNGTSSSLKLGRFTESGARDSTFSSAPFQFNLEASINDPDAIALQSNGKVLVGGLAANLDPFFDDFGLVRLNRNGTLDATFGSGGRVTEAPSGSISGLLIQKDGKIVAVGGGSGGILARYLSK